MPSDTRYRFANFELDSTTGELRRNGMRVRLHVQPFQVLKMLVERPGELLTREEISRTLWPDGTFVDYEHGVNSAVNRLREALGDKASQPRFVETLARRGYRFVAPVERIGQAMDAGALAVGAEVGEDASAETSAASWSGVLTQPDDLPKSSQSVVQTLFLLLQVMYVWFYVGALANLTEINQLMADLPFAKQVFSMLILTASLLIPVRVFLICAALFRARHMRRDFLRIWWGLLSLDLLWALSPFLLLHHMPAGLALACTAPLVYAPFAQRSLVLMGAGQA
jgi:DNA-binding winged helix-turn-helix (wHTH) protein